MQVSIGTFNLNNLFSRFNFSAQIAALPPHEAGGIELTFTENEIKARTFMGRLVKGKDAAETAKIANRILSMDVDILGVQEVEHIEILKEFNRTHLNGLYNHVVLIEGNDRRMIDVGLMSKLPIGAITSHQAARHKDNPGKRAFGRDLLEVEILDDQGKKLLTIYNSHMKSHFVPHGQNPVEGARAANKRRQQQAEVTRDLISARERKGAKFVLLGDMNDPPDSEFLTPMLTIDDDPLSNGLANAQESQPLKPEHPANGPGPSTAIWTHRFDPGANQFPHYELYDQIWLSKSLSGTLQSAHIDRRVHSVHGDGSDHDPAWVVLDI